MNPSLSAIHQFVQSNNYILKINGNNLEAVKRNSIFTWFATRVFHLKSYNLQNVVNFWNSHVREFEQDKGTMNTGIYESLRNFPTKLNKKIDHFNDNHPNKPVTVKITHLFAGIFPHTVASGVSSQPASSQPAAPQHNVNPRFPENQIAADPAKDNAALNETISKLQAIPYTTAFYKTGLTAFLGNFFSSKINMSNIVINGVRLNNTYECAEAAFQHIKWLIIADENKGKNILKDSLMSQFSTADGQKAFNLKVQLEKNYPGIYPKQWQNGLRDEVMWQILNIKFSDPSLLAMLKATGKTFLIEHNEASRDDYWSDNSTGVGKFNLMDGKYYPNDKSNTGVAGNVLGLMLMAIRAGQPMPQVTSQHLQDTQANLRNALDFNRLSPIF